MNKSLRTTTQRKAHAIHKLEHDRDVWVATASMTGIPHLVPFSLVWDGANIITATPVGSPTVKNLQASNRARLALGDTRDVMIVDTEVNLVNAREADSFIGDLFASKNDWDPRTLKTDYMFLIMKPVKVQVWENEDELEGRTIMKDGRWLA